MPTRRRDPRKVSDPPSQERPRSSGAAPAGEGVRDALSVLHNLAALLRRSASRTTLDGLLSEVEGASVSLRSAFALARPELRVFVEKRIQMLDDMLVDARTSGAWDLVLEPSQTIASDLSAASELHDLCERLGDRTPLVQRLDAIAQDLTQHWHPLAAEGTLHLSLAEEAAAREIPCDPRVAASLLALVVSLVDTDGVHVSLEGNAFRFAPGPAKGRVVPRLRRIEPTLEIARHVTTFVGGTFEQKDGAILVTLRS